MFSPETTAFLSDLAANNRRDWFQDNKARYDAVMKTPAKHFAADLSARLARHHGVDTREKIFRVNRDLRFSKDKTPYNAHIHISVSDAGTGAAWMFGLEPTRVFLGYGAFAFGKDALTQWRMAVDRDGAALDAAIRSGGFDINDPELKRVPSPFASDHPQGHLLRCKGLCVWKKDTALSDAFGSEAAGTIAQHMTCFDPVRDWLRAHMFGVQSA